MSAPDRHEAAAREAHTDAAPESVPSGAAPPIVQHPPQDVAPLRRFARQADGDYRWEAVEMLRYKEPPADGGRAPFKDITRQVLFAPADHASELRYFEVAPGGFSTLERHQHTHAVLILRGRGTVQLGEVVQPIAENDLVSVEPMTWHQFRAAPDAALGFLCLVSRERDRPQLPDEAERARLEAAAGAVKPR